MIKDDINKLMGRFRKEVNSNSAINLVDLFKQSLKIFEEIKDVMSKGDDEEKKEALQLMTELHDFLHNESLRLAKKTGLTEDQLARFAENPNNFSDSQWRSLEMIKTKLNKSASELAHIMKQNAKAPKADTPMVAESKKATKEEKVHKKYRSSKKDRWMRS